MAAGYIMFSVMIMFVLSIITFIGTYFLVKSIKQYYVKRKIASINMNDYDMVVSAGGFPKMLIKKEDRNSIIYL